MKIRKFYTRSDARTWATYNDVAVVSIEPEGDLWIVKYYP